MADDIRDVIDSLMRQPKTPVGTPEWNPTTREDELRAKIPLLIDGEISDLELTVIAYPRRREVIFRLIVAADKAVWRVDFAEDKAHFNSLNKPDDLELGPICGPHYHAWPDNRRFATAGNLPDKLHNARGLPPNIQSYHNAFRWFCGETNIDIGDFPVPDLPPSDMLL